MARKRDGIGIAIAFLLGVLMLKKKSSGIAWGEGWHWPVPDLIIPGSFMAGIPEVLYPAVVSQEFKTNHAGVDIMYRRRTLADRPEWSANGSTSYFAPPGTPILAARDARVWSVDKAATGIQVVLDHGKPWATYYAHLDTTSLAPHARGFQSDGKTVTHIKAGDQIGTMGWNPNTLASNGAVDPSHIRHLHFECWYQGSGNKAAQDPDSVMPQWGRSTWQI